MGVGKCVQLGDPIPQSLGGGIELGCFGIKLSLQISGVGTGCFELSLKRLDGLLQSDFPGIADRCVGPSETRLEPADLSMCLALPNPELFGCP